MRRARPQRGFDLLGRVGAGEQEAEVAVAFGERHDVSAARHGDLEAGDAGHRARRVLTADLLAALRHCGIGSIITPDADVSRSMLVEGQPERVAQDQLLECDAGAEAQRARAQAADRPRRDLDHRDAIAVDAQLGVDRPVGEPECARPRAR